ncbi:MAG: lasso peptide biosynthesis B2 protein [Gammaproteobacteria bacterium]|nr:lasso peptide biosynthesis B2 protein [Gammaproteobacteria bacterium]MDH3466870.1 lasso peptide biosynthesis B2 protein [Gammaproteobacteria bacterium]
MACWNVASSITVFGHFTRLPARHKIWLAEAWLMLLWAYFQTRRPFHTWRRHLLAIPKSPTDRHCRTQPTELFDTLSRLIDAAANRHIVRMTCLPRSLTLQRMLARLGVTATIRSGLLPTDAGLEAHAWVELDSVALDSRPDTAVNFHVLDMKSHRKLLFESNTS